MFVLRYLREVLARLRPLLAINGGPVIMVELDHSGDKEQTLLFVEELDPLVVIFAGEDTNPHSGESMSPLEALLHPDVGETVRDRRRVHVSSLRFPGAVSKLALSVQLNLASAWGNVPVGMTHEETAYLFYNLAAKNESFCVHMFQGGTNFGFTAGAVIMPRSGRFAPLMTAYSSLSALAEDSLPGCNYYIIRDYLVGKNSESYPWPRATSYGRLQLRTATCLLDQQTIWKLASSAWHADSPLTFEYLRQAAGFVLYETIVPEDLGAAVLRTPQLHDRAQVFVGSALMGILSRSAQRLQIPLFALRRGDVLRILVESEGRVAVHLLPEQRYKGLTYDKDVTLDNIPLRNWTMYGFPMDNGSLIHDFLKSSEGECNAQCSPVLYAAEFIIQGNISVPLDTHFDMAGWGRGFVFLNGHNLGRYWSSVGPQVSLYVPGSFLRAPPAINRLAVLELEHAHPLHEVMSVSQPVFARFANRVAPVLTAFLVLTVTLSVVAICARKATAWIYET